jgi:transposase
MDILVERCAALDVHKNTVVACVRLPSPDGGRLQELRAFKATTAGLLGLADWPDSYQVTLVGMEATGCYWKPVWQALEDRVCCWLLGARHVRNLPGRKTDMADAVWLCLLVEHGMVRPSFVPARPIRELRDLTRYRKTQIQERSREVQRLDKVLQDAGIKLSSVATDIIGVSGRAMLEALVAGTHDPEVLAALAKGPAPDQAAGAAGGVGRPVPHRPSRAAGRPDPGPHRLPGRDRRGVVCADRAGDCPVR